jgi:hypothetical protein
MSVMAPEDPDTERNAPEMARSFERLRSEMSPNARERVDLRVRRTLLEMTLQELRQNASGKTRDEQEELLELIQDAISQLEGRQDPLLGDLAKCINALGGGLELVACFPDSNVRIKLFKQEDERTAATGA